MIQRLKLQFGIYLLIIAAGNVVFAQSRPTSQNRTTTKVNVSTDDLSEQGSTTEGRASQSTETAGSNSNTADYGSFTGVGRSADALSFATRDFEELQIRQIIRSQYEGSYVNYPVNVPPNREYELSTSEAEFCLSCLTSQIQFPPINLNGSLFGEGNSGNGSLRGGIPLNRASSSTSRPVQGTMKQAIKQMCDYVKKNPRCGPNKYAVVSDVSRGSGSIHTAIIDISTCGTSGDATIVDQFPTGGGSGGVGNVPESHATPPGFFQLTQSGRNTRKNWPTCNNGNSFNYFVMQGQGCKFNMPGESCQNTNAQAREILYHTWPRIGASTWGCTGVPQDRFCSWGSKIQGSCLYNYIGS